MLKYLVICPVVFLTLIATAQAQEEHTLSKWYTEASFGIGTPSFNNADTYLTTWGMNMGFGYDLSPRFTLKVPVSLSWNLFNNDENSSPTYHVNGLAGLAAGYYPGNGRRWQLTAEAGHSIRKSDEWKCFYYDLGFRINPEAPHSCVGFYGLSIRQYISEIKGTPNYFMLHCIIGLKQNWKRP